MWYERGYKAGWDAGRNAARSSGESLPRDLRRELVTARRSVTALRAAGQRIWERLSTSNGWLAFGGTLREDTIPNNEAALQETKILFFGSREP